jgi:hypothetical protein
MKKLSFLFTTLLIVTVALTVKPADKNKSSITNGGNHTETGTWVDQASGFATVSRGIEYMDVLSANVAWATAYNGTSPTTYIVEFTRTINGGTTWTASAISGYASGWGTSMVVGVSATKAWIPVFNATAGGGRILATTDGGATWTHQTTATFAAPAGFPNVIHFWNDNEGFCMGDPNGGYFEIYTTTNGGTNWVRVAQANIPAPIAADEYGTVGYYSVVGNTVWFATNKGRIFKSIDKGLNWTVLTTPIGANQFKVVMRDALYGIIQNPATSVAYRTTDGGASWNLLSPTGNFFSNDFCYVTGTTNTWVSTGAATGTSGASYSTDGGTTWLDFANTSGTQFLNVDFSSPTDGWAGAFNQSATVGGVKKYIGNLVPVELTSFTASTSNGSVNLQWRTATETNNRIFEIERKSENTEYLTVGFVNGQGTTTQAHDYTFSDNSVIPGSYSYRLKQIDYDGRFSYSNVVNVEITAPTVLQLSQNYPNPFNPTTTISYSLAQAGNVRLAVYNTLGQEITTLVNEFKESGNYQISFDAVSLSSGVYLYKLEAPNFVQIKKMVVNK